MHTVTVYKHTVEARVARLVDAHGVDGAYRFALDMAFSRGPIAHMSQDNAQSEALWAAIAEALR